VLVAADAVDPVLAGVGTVTWSIVTSDSDELATWALTWIP
jgi:hypothetical protein